MVRSLFTVTLVTLDGKETTYRNIRAWNESQAYVAVRGFQPHTHHRVVKQEESDGTTKDLRTQ